MTNFDFFILLGENIWIFLLSLAIALSVYIWIGKKISSSWMNPIKFNIFTAGIGMSVALFLFFIGEIANDVFFYVVLSSILFWSLLIRYYSNNQRVVYITFSKEPYFANRLFMILYILNISLTLFSYKMFGIPIFNENSRLAVYVGSGGWGLINRVTPMMSTYIIFYVLSQYNDKKYSFSKICWLLIPLIIFGILSGSRSSFISYIFCYWAVKTFYIGKEPLLSNYKKVLLPFILISIITFFIQRADVLWAIIAFFERIVACGDLYWMALCNDTWESVSIQNPIKYILIGLLGPFRIMDVTFAETPIGYQLTSLVYNGYDKMTGPVALFPVSSMILFGYVGGLVFTVLQALFAAFSFRLTYIKSNSIIMCVLSYYIFINIIPFMGDCAASMGGIFDIIVNICFVFLLLLIIALYTYIKNGLK